MPAMTEQQAKHAMETLAKLWAERKGFQNPQITVIKKDTKEKGA